MTVKHSDLKKASSPAQRKRMLSLAAADTEKTLMPKDSEQHLDSEMDHTLSPGIEENGKINENTITSLINIYTHDIFSICSEYQGISKYAR